MKKFRPATPRGISAEARAQCQACHSGTGFSSVEPVEPVTASTETLDFTQETVDFFKENLDFTRENLDFTQVQPEKKTAWHSWAAAKTTRSCPGNPSIWPLFSKKNDMFRQQVPTNSNKDIGARVKTWCQTKRGKFWLLPTQFPMLAVMLNQHRKSKNVFCFSWDNSPY